MAEKKLTVGERMKLLCEKSMEFISTHLGEAEERPYFATLGIPGNDRVEGLLEIGKRNGSWYVMAGAFPQGSDRLYSQYLKTGTREEIAAYLAAPGSPAELERTLWETVQKAEG